ncbi:MAG: hypothetical protein ACOC8E_05095 [Planctomycetota bacterium]
MTHNNFWNADDLGKYLRLLRNVERARAERLERARRRVEGGYYLTDEIARATAERMLAPNQRDPPR